MFFCSYRFAFAFLFVSFAFYSWDEGCYDVAVLLRWEKGGGFVNCSFIHKVGTASIRIFRLRL